MLTAQLFTSYSKAWFNKCACIPSCVILFLIYCFEWFLFSALTVKSWQDIISIFVKLIFRLHAECLCHKYYNLYKTTKRHNQVSFALFHLDTVISCKKRSLISGCSLEKLKNHCVWTGYSNGKIKIYGHIAIIKVFVALQQRPKSSDNLDCYHPFVSDQLYHKISFWLKYNASIAKRSSSSSITFAINFYNVFLLGNSGS